MALFDLPHLSKLGMFFNIYIFLNWIDGQWLKETNSCLPNTFNQFSGSISFGPPRSRSFNHQSKKSKKNLAFHLNILWLLHDFSSLKNYINVKLPVMSKKNGILKAADKKSRIRIMIPTIPKRKQKRSDIEANYRNETKTFWCVPKKEVERFYLVQKLWIEIITFWCVPEPLRSKSGRFC